MPEKLRRKTAALQADYGQQFAPFFRWLFEMGKAIAALNHNLMASAVRAVPLAEGMMLMEAALGSWEHLANLKAFCEEKHAQPITKDLWTQIGRFVNMTKIGTISSDLSNYDDEDAGGSAWPCAIDDFVEFVQAKASS